MDTCPTCGGKDIETCGLPWPHPHGTYNLHAGKIRPCCQDAWHGGQWYMVTTVENVYETYNVHATDEAHARAIVLVDETRAKLDSYPDGANGDLDIIEVMEIDPRGDN